MSLPVAAQRRTTNAPRPNPTAITGAYGEPAATMSGILKRIGSKQIVLVVGGDQDAEILRTKKTKFFAKGAPITPDKIHEGALLSIDVGKDPDLNPIAVNVRVEENGPPPKE